jgi:hypothetical protein
VTSPLYSGADFAMETSGHARDSSLVAPLSWWERGWG